MDRNQTCQAKELYLIQWSTIYVVIKKRYYDLRAYLLRNRFLAECVHVIWIPEMRHNKITCFVFFVGENLQFLNNTEFIWSCHFISVFVRILGIHAFVSCCRNYIIYPIDNMLTLFSSHTKFKLMFDSYWDKWAVIKNKIILNTIASAFSVHGSWSSGAIFCFMHEFICINSLSAWLM